MNREKFEKVLNELMSESEENHSMMFSIHAGDDVTTIFTAEDMESKEKAREFMGLSLAPVAALSDKLLADYFRAVLNLLADRVRSNPSGDLLKSLKETLEDFDRAHETGSLNASERVH